MKLKLWAVLLTGLFFSLPARAELAIDVSGAMRDPMPIALPEMIHDGFFLGQQGDKIRDVIAADLERSGLFDVIDPDSYIQEFSSMTEEPAFTDWKAIRAQALVQSEIQEIDSNNLKVSFRLWDVYTETQMEGQSYTTTKDNWRRVAHVIADAIYERLTGEKGYFDTRIVYVSESGPATRRVKRLAIMDQDGENHKFLTDGLNLVLTPRLGNFPGMTFAPRFSPDSSKVLLSFASGGKTNIYEMDLATRKSRRLTYGNAIDTSPSYSPDGSQIVFNSDRGGNQQLYVMNADGSDVKRISFGSGRYATPVWSPRGDYIAFTKMANGQFYIGVMYPDGSGERLLASGYLVEGPTWSPNGRVLMYFRQDKPRGHTSAPVKLYSIDLTGYNERQIITPADASDPAWSPLLP